MISSYTNKIEWFLPKPVSEEILKEAKLLDPIRALIVRRGITNINELDKYLHPKEPESPYLHFRQLKKSISRIKKAIEEKEKIAICGDYDADGLTSSTVLLKALKYLNAKAKASIPSRLEDGYGLNKKMVRNLNEDGVTLIITVDNGVNASEALEYAKENSIDVIVTDHHKLPSKLPTSYSLIHPELTPADSEYKILAGVGLAYLIGKELLKGIVDDKEIEVLDQLLCIGTIADMAPLKGANYYWLKKYIPQLKFTTNKGLLSLYKLSGLVDKEISSQDIAFKIAPRINAAGRIHDPHKIIELFLENNEENSMIIARECEELNKERRKLVDGIVQEAKAIIDSSNDSIPSFIVLAQNHWHQGVIGIVASRIMDHYNRPTAILTNSESGYFTGSARSFEGFSIIKLLEYSSSVLDRFGGHEYAGGFKIKAENLGKFQNKVLKYSNNILNEKFLTKNIKPESNLKFSQINEFFCLQLKKLEPFGNDNKQPLFWTDSCKIIKTSILNGQHSKFTLEQSGNNFTAIMWNNLISYNVHDIVDIAFHIFENDWQNKKSIELEIIAIKKSSKKHIITKGNNMYSINLNDNLITIENKLGNKISAIIDNDGIISINRTDPEEYIRNLFEEALIVLGLKN